MGRRSRLRQALAAVVVVSVASIAATAAALAASSSGGGGSFRVFDTSTGPGTGGHVLLTGAIGDHGRSEPVTKSGKVSKSGGYTELRLSRGTVTLKTTALDHAFGRSSNGVVANRATCSLSAAANGTVSIVSGTGHYAGIKGSAHVTAAVGFILQRRHGKCDGDASPIASQQLVYGTGTASF